MIQKYAIFEAPPSHSENVAPDENEYFRRFWTVLRLFMSDFIIHLSWIPAFLWHKNNKVIVQMTSTSETRFFQANDWHN